MKQINPSYFAWLCKQAVIILRHIPFTVEEMAAEQGWILAHAGKPAHAALRWGEVVELNSSPTELLLLLHCHPQSNTQFSFPAAVPINAQFDYINTKWCGFLDIPHFIDQKKFFFFLFHTHSLSMATTPSRRSNGEVSCFWRWRLWPLYYQHPVVRTMSKIYTWMQNSICQFYMNRKPRFEVFGL